MVCSLQQSLHIIPSTSLSFTTFYSFLLLFREVKEEVNRVEIGEKESERGEREGRERERERERRESRIEREERESSLCTHIVLQTASLRLSSVSPLTGSYQEQHLQSAETHTHTHTHTHTLTHTHSHSHSHSNNTHTH